ncbi:hypothetical protein [Clostridium thailandense]|uniref:hypothetical protein n=1 Tax=Clostridium thailandense TaxID=2794346 RepID=UPI003989CA73
MENLELKDLKPCDVLLCRGEGFISDMIVLFDGGTYSHSALYAGEIDGKHCIIQATARGVVCDPIEKITEETFTDVFRFKKDGHNLGDADYPFAPVQKVGLDYVNAGVKYAYDHLILLAVVAATHNIPLDPFSKKILRSILDNAAEFIFKLIDEGKTPMVCSEVVYRCFDEADSNKKYQLNISEEAANCLLANVQKSFKETDLDDNQDLQVDKDLQKAKEKFVAALNKANQKKQLSAAPELETDNALSVVSACVTPKDLEKCKDLIKLGRLTIS